MFRTFSTAGRQSASGRRKNDEKKNKQRVDYEPHSAHGRVANKMTPLVYGLSCRPLTTWSRHEGLTTGLGRFKVAPYSFRIARAWG